MTALASSPVAVAGEERVEEARSLSVEERLQNIEKELLKVRQDYQEVRDVVTPLAGLATEQQKMASQLDKQASRLDQHASQLAVVTSSIADTYAAYRHEAAVSYSQAYLPSLRLLLAEPPASFTKGVDKLA
ncbi:hypothetical protein NBRC10513_005601 [Rhodotorula toruloides]